MGKSVSQMRPTEILLRALRRNRPASRVLQKLVERLVLNSQSRSRLNHFYNRLNADEKTVFHNLFSKIFRDKKANIADCFWSTEFLGKPINLPLRSEMMWLDWDNALSIVGHDTDVKATYETLLKQNRRIDVFFDVGANYGTHSLLMLSQGVDVVSFEPNPNCQKEFENLCRINGLQANVQNFAVSDRPGSAEFWFPERDTWLGTMVDSTRDSLAGQYDLKKIEVAVTTLDDFVEQSGQAPDLIKIDTEGNELKVICGALKTIESKRPLIIFEANSLSSRQDLGQIFSDLKYAVSELPLTSLSAVRNLDSAEFQSSPSFNFIVLPESLKMS